MVNTIDRFAQEPPDGEPHELVLDRLAAIAEGNCIGDHDPADRSLGQARHRPADEDRMRGGTNDVGSALLGDDRGRLTDRPRGGDHVVDHQHRPTRHLADDVARGDLDARFAPLVDDGQIRAQTVGEHVGDLHVAHVR